MRLLRSAMQVGALAGSVVLGNPGLVFCANVLSGDESLCKHIPAEAYERVGVWENGDYWIAVGRSTEIDAFDKNKGKHAQTDFAESEAKALILKQAALA